MGIAASQSSVFQPSVPQWVQAMDASVNHLIVGGVDNTLGGLGAVLLGAGAGASGRNANANPGSDSASAGFGSGMMDKVAEFLAGSKLADKPAQMSSAVVVDQPSPENLGGFVSQQFQVARTSQPDRGAARFA